MPRPNAAATGQFVLHYQPCIALRTGRPVRVEALIRWQHPRYGLLAPDQFVELAELSGAIQPMTRWVVREGMAAAETWRAAGHELGLAVNLSVRNLYDPELVAYLESALEDHGMPPGDLILELTETELMDDPSLAREVVTALGEGVRLREAEHRLRVVAVGDEQLPELDEGAGATIGLATLRCSSCRGRSMRMKLGRAISLGWSSI